MPILTITGELKPRRYLTPSKKESKKRIKRAHKYKKLHPNKVSEKQAKIIYDASILDKLEKMF